MSSVAYSKPAGIIEVAPKMTMEWLLGGRVVAYTMGSSERRAVETLTATVLENMQNWPQDQPYLAIYEITENNIAITPHVRANLSQLIAAHPDLNGRYAAVLPGTGASHAIRLFLITRSKEGVRERKVFYEREKALDWLQEGLA